MLTRLPSEVIAYIVEYLPVDEMLGHVGWTCRCLARVVFGDLTAAARHVELHHKRVSAHVDSQGTDVWKAFAGDDVWLWLPFHHCVAFVSLSARLGFAAHGNGWLLPAVQDPTFALRIVSALAKYSHLLRLSAQTHWLRVASWCASFGHLNALRVVLGHLEVCSQQRASYADSLSMQLNPICFAAHSGSLNCVDILLNSVEFAPIDFCHGLYHASVRSHIDVARYLIVCVKHCLNESNLEELMNIRKRLEMTLLSSFGTFGAKSDAILSILLMERSLFDPSINQNYLCCKASEKGFSKVLELVLGDPRVNPMDNNGYPLIWACIGGHADCVRLLIAHPAVDPSWAESISLIHAVRHGHANVVELLLRDGRVDPCAQELAALRLAYEKGHSQVVSLLKRDRRVIERAGVFLMLE